jgi:hypothetical protein
MLRVAGVIPAGNTDAQWEGVQQNIFLVLQKYLLGYLKVCVSMGGLVDWLVGWLM